MKKLEVNINILKDKSIQQYNKIINCAYYFIGKALAFYFIYKFIMTIKNFFFSDYDKINLNLKSNNKLFLDQILITAGSFCNLRINPIYSTFIDQYFSLLLVGIIIISNMRSFLNTVLFLYSKFFSNQRLNQKIQILILSKFIALLYLNASFSLIFSLPLPYR